MFKLFKNKKENKTLNNDDLLSKTGSLLIHAAKIDENYTDKEKEIVKKTLLDLGANQQNIDTILEKAEQNEKDSNQIIDFTREIKNSDDEFKKKIVETLWNIIYSDDLSDMYETNLMRRLSGLLYLDNKVVGDIKQRIKSKLLK